jgi:alanine racemase
MRSLLLALRQYTRRSETLIEVRVSREALLHNYDVHKETYGLLVAPVLKSNAYGHGLLEVARVLAQRQPPFFVVDSYFEAKMLRAYGIKTPVLVVGYTPLTLLAQNRLRGVSFTLTSLEALRECVALRARARVHIKLDTGMHRQGLLPEEVDEAIGLVRESGLTLEGVCSHFSDADGSEDFTRKQIALWNELVGKWTRAFPNIQYRHIAASAGSAFSKECDANLMRIGSGLYGIERIPTRKLPLRPTLSLMSRLTVVKSLKEREFVGYNRTFEAKGAMRIATVPVGYFEGVDRRLSNAGMMLVDEVPCPIIGRVSMNMSTLDVTHVPDANIGDRVVVISDKLGDPNSIERLAALCDTTPLELLVHIPSHLRRVIV